MRLEWLEYFSDAARLGSIKASADRHNISPQGLSKCVRSLEAELGVKLFERDANSVRLTPEGAHLLGQVRVTVDAAHELTRQAQSIKAGNAKASLAIMCSVFVFLSGMMEPLRRGVDTVGRTATYTQVHTDEMFAVLKGKMNALYEGRVLCGVPILFGPLHEHNEDALQSASLNGYDYVPLVVYEDGVLVSAGHPLSSRGSVSRAELLDYPVVSSSTEQFAALDRYLGSGHIASAISDLASRLQVIQDNASIMFMPPFFEVADDERYRFLPVEDAYEVEVGLIYDRSELSAREIESMLALSLERFAAFEAAGSCSIAFRP